MTSNEQATGDLSSNVKSLSRNIVSIDLNEIQQDKNEFESTKEILFKEYSLWKSQCNQLTMQKQTIEKQFTENQQLIDDKDNEIQDIQETIDVVKYEKIINELQNENSRLKESLQLKEQSEKEYNKQIQILQEQIKELEDWNEDFQNNNSSNLQSTIDMLTIRNHQLENDFQRLQLQQENNQLSLERLDEYEETISQLQEQINQLRSNKKQSSSKYDNDHVENLERQILKLTNEIQLLENQNNHLQQQFQITPGSPPSVSSKQDTQLLSSFKILYDQFLSLLPNELISSDKSNLSLTDRFVDLFEQFSSYIGTFSIVQEELDSLKQILNEKQDELEKLRTDFEITTEKLTLFQEEQSLANKNKSFDSDEDELDEILGFQHRAPSQQSLLSITPGEKQLLLAQNELLSTLLTEKERELIEIQQIEKTLRFNYQQIENEREEKQNELNHIRNILDEKLQENSSLKNDKLFFIEKLTQLERKQQSIIQLPLKQSTSDREKSPSTIHTQQQYQTLQSDYDQLLQLSTKQHEESLSYYNEYTRILNISNELNEKYNQLNTDYESLQSIIQEKNQAYIQCQNELNNYQNLYYHLKKTTDDIDLLRSTLNERNIQLENFIENEKQWKNQQIQYEIKLKLFDDNQRRIDEIQLDLKRVIHERDLTIIENKQLENQNQIKILQTEEREQKLNEEIERLLQLIDQIEMKNRQSEQILSNELENIKFDYIKLEQINNDLNEKMKNLQNNSQQKQEYENHQKFIQYEQMRQYFQNEILNRDTLINKYQLEIAQLNENFLNLNNSRVEKQLVKNILLSYFHTPIDKQQEVIPLLGALVGFTQDEYQKAIDTINGHNWLTGWLGSTSSKSKTQSEAPVYHPDKSFAELLIQYVDHQSIDNLQNPVLKHSTDNSSVSTSDNPTQFTT